MTNKNKNKWIPILMAVSQLLLTAFVIYWLFGQYKNERENLNKEMHFEFVQAQNQAMDSSLHVMLKPYLNDSLPGRDSIKQIDVYGPTNMVDSVEVNSYVTTKRTTSGQFIELDLRDSLLHSSGSSASYEITASPSEEVLLRGVKMIIKLSEDSMGHAGKTLSSFKVDTAVLMDIASKRLKKSEHSNFGILWHQDSLKRDSVRPKSKIIFNSTFSEPGMLVEITNYKPFIIKKIIPQILFGLLLLLLTSFAFIFTYRSLKRQLLLNTLRNEFISNVSHELKTPVSTVKVALEALQNYDQKKDKIISGEYLKMASLEMDRLDLLIQKILTQSLLESNRVIIQRQRMDLIEICKKVIYSQQARLDDLKGELMFYTDLETAFSEVDELYIQGVLINLIDNAIKYGGIPPIIEIGLASAKNKYFISVKDNGPGIPKEYQERVFERFFRIPSGDRHNVKGYGLGLSFASEVMKQHGGKIELEDNPDGGSIFKLIFSDHHEA